MGNAEASSERSPAAVADDVLRRLEALSSREQLDQPGHTISDRNLFIAISWFLRQTSVRLNAAGVHLDVSSIVFVPDPPCARENLCDLLNGVRRWRDPPDLIVDGLLEPAYDILNVVSDVFTQLRVQQQVHSGACGHHALYNAAMVYHGRPINEMYSLEHFYGRMLQCLRLLSARFPSTDFSTGVVDDIHLRVCAMEVYDIPSSVLCIAPTADQPLDAQDDGVRVVLLGAVTHWVSCVRVGDHIYYMDSHNKVLFRSDHDAVAADALEKHAPIFKHRVQIDLPQYSGAPDVILDELYDFGVPEYHRQQSKSPLYWKRRPKALRHDLIVAEMQACEFFLRKSFLNTVKTDPRTPALPATSSLLPSSTSRVYTTHTATDPLFVRKDEPLDIIDPTTYPSLENRKKPPPTEHADDVFDRQRVIAGWDQRRVEGQRVCVIGTGGIGMNAVLNLCRLGVERVTMVDYDIYDASNLTRQCLGSTRDVGRAKLDAAFDNVAHHNLRSRVVSLTCDVVGDFGSLVDELRATPYTAIFNCVDAGPSVDVALNAVSKALGIPYVVGQSFAWKFMIELYAGAHRYNCQQCDVGVPFPHASLVDLKPRGKELLRKCDDDMESYLYECRRLCSPDNVLSLRSLEMLPFPANTDTRWIGSWVGPCLGAATLMVSAWANFLTGPTHRNPPSVLLFNLDEGMTAEESMFYELNALGQSDVEFQDRRRVCDESDASCVVCAARVSVVDDRERIFLKPVDGVSVAVDGLTFSKPGEGVLTLDGESVPALNAFVDGAPPSYNLYPLDMPLMRCTYEEYRAHPSSIECAPSGRRSALVRLGNGELYRLKGCGDLERGFHIDSKLGKRGCMFENTAARAIFMTQRIGEAVGMVANTPVCYYRYAHDADAICVVFKTIGDARAGDHLLAGLSAGVSTAKEDSAREWLSGRDAGSTSSMVECGVPVIDCLAIAPRDAGLLVAARCGFAVGEFLRKLHHARISWGTYPDASGIHCNAHINNFVIEEGECELFALDFDMAYSEEDFVFDAITTKTPAFPDTFEEILKFEALAGMRVSLSGSDFGSTGVGGSDGTSFYDSAIRDTAVAWFDRGYAGGTPPPRCAEAQSAARAALAATKTVST